MQKSLTLSFISLNYSTLCFRSRFIVGGFSTRSFGMASMKAANRLKVAFDEGKGPSMGCWQMIPGSNVSRTLARTGVDWVLVDCEVRFHTLETAFSC
jgi:hypothetical protein